MLTCIDLSGFGECSKTSLKDLTEAVELMPCLRAVSLRQNGITDDYDGELLALLSCKALVKLDFSQNFLTKKTALAIGKKLKDECSHI